jgi:lysophospholipase L1-like esterase
MPGKRINKYVKNLAAFGIGLVLAFLAGEIFLRIYNPYTVRIKGDRIILPANEKDTYTNIPTPDLDDTVYYSTNSLGFRGLEKPADFDKALTIVAVGGSTTECASLSDGDDWPSVLNEVLKKDFPNAWVNNAGIGGHSTYGHLLLLEDYIIKLKPDYVLFLTGANEVNRPDLDLQDSIILLSKQNWRGRLASHSELISLIHNLWLARRPGSFKLRDHHNDGIQIKDTLTMTPAQAAETRKSHAPYIASYASRLRQLIDVSRKHGIEPVFCTQPILWGYATDPQTGRNLANINTHGIPSGVAWEVWEMYNNQLRSICKELNVHCIDLSAKMPKNSLYFYDDMHYNKAGAKKVAEIIGEDLKDFLHSRTDNHSP